MNLLYKTTHGFTLIEMVMAVAILAILMTIAAPSFRSLTMNNRIVTQTNEFVTDIAHARAEAVRRNTRVTICKSNDGATCVNSANWQDGWIVFTDPNTYGTVNTDETILRAHAALADGTTLSAAGFDNSGNYFQFSSTGQVIGVSGGTPSTMGTFTLCISGFLGRTVSFGTTGRVSVATMASNCT